MIRLLLALGAIALLFSGCVNKRGVSAKYYNDCREYYDMQGYYHKQCDENLVEFEDVKKTLKETFPTEEETPQKEPPKVW